MQSSTSHQLEESARTLWAGALPPYVEEHFLYRLFAPTGELVSARVMRDRHTGHSQGFAFLEFATPLAAQEVLNTYDGKQIPGTDHVLRLNWAAFGLGRSTEGGDGMESHSLFVGDLALDVTDLLLQRHFQQYFPSVISAKVITERSTGRSKGYGFVRFSSSAERDKALSCMEGHIIHDRPIRVSHATAKKYQGDGKFHPSDLDPSNTTAFVGNVNTDVTEEDLTQVFRRCGEIEGVKLLRAKGCAFVTYKERSSAERAIAELHGKVIKNCAIRLCWGRRSSQMVGQLPALSGGVGLLGYQSQFVGGGRGYHQSRWGPSPAGFIGGLPPDAGLLSEMPPLGALNAALHSASIPGHLAFPPDQGLAALQQFPVQTSALPDTLQALANLSLSASGA